MSIRAGIVGLPNVGKSSLFNLLTNAGAECSNYPFCTKSPNVGICIVNDERLKKIGEKIPYKKIIPASIEIVDLAGLVNGAHRGEGLGNLFLSYIREVDAILHTVRVFKNPNVVHVAGEVNPERDILTVETELLLADLESVEKQYEKVRKAVKSGDKDLVTKVEVLEKIKTSLDKGEQVRGISFNEKEKEIVANLSLLTYKPVLFVANIDEAEAWENSYEFRVFQALSKRFNDSVVEVPVKFELELLDLELQEREEFRKEMGFFENKVDKLIKSTYDLLGLITFFTTQSEIIQAWSILKGKKAPEAAGKIHSDFEKGFISAEIFSFETLCEYKNEEEIRKSGKIRIEGRNYIVQDGDIIYFKFNV